jgi:hypothetical protein
MQKIEKYRNISNNTRSKKEKKQKRNKKYHMGQLLPVHEAHQPAHTPICPNPTSYNNNR